ncbi:MAG: YgiT-type zinc finger protein [Myxococcales bacterium]|nr:YgiT-type zinc finger protein [Myxococcales bacterium]
MPPARRIRQAVIGRLYEFTRHALEEMDDDGLSETDVRFALLRGEVVASLGDDRVHCRVTMKPDFCEYCNGALQTGERLVTVHRHVGDRHFIFERVPARVCPRCGERYFSAAIVRKMDREMKHRRRTSLRPVPIISLSPEG